MRCPPKTKAGRLLRVLFLRVGSMPVRPTAHRTRKAVTSRRFPPPWSVEELDAAVGQLANYSALRHMQMREVSM